MAEFEGGRSDLLVAFVDVDSHRSFRPDIQLKDGERVRLIRVKPHGFHVFRSDRCKLHIFKDEVLSQLIDQAHLVLTETAYIEIENSSMFTGLVHIWIEIGIRRESVELVSKKVRHRVLNFHIVPGSWNLDNKYRKAIEDWRISKHYRLESSKDASGFGLIPPADVIKLELYEHQKQGLRWMVDREELPAGDDDELPPFWEEKDGCYRDSIGPFITLKRPHKIRGGILADESGMGKTLTLLSLIAYTKAKQMSKSEDASISHARKKQKVDYLPLKEVEDMNFEWRPTLVVCPPSVLATWKVQIEQCTSPGGLQVCTYHGKNKTKDPNSLKQHDIVLTTYSLLVKEAQESESGNSSLLNKIDWWRVVLDDAHVLKGSTSRATTPFVNLRAKRRWAVTGKPIHKDFETYPIYPILAFLQVQPFCDIVGFRANRVGTEVLMGIFSLRRTMPVRFIENCHVVMSKEEQDLYGSMEAEAKRVAKDSPRFLHAAVLHLWQICNSLALCRFSCAAMVPSANFRGLSGKPKLLKKWVTVLQEEKDYACPVCMDLPEDMVITRCGHLFCRRCIMLMFGRNSIHCPLCRGSLTTRGIFSAQRGPSVMEKTKSITEEGSSSAIKSSKVSALLSLLTKSRAEDPNKKSLVFSQFGSMQTLVDGVLSEAGFKVRRINATDNAKTKVKTVEEFSIAEPPVVLITTYKALSNTRGLDLSVGSNVYLMEPCWNAYTEEEALACIHRFGKNDEANVIRLVCKNSIEERMLELRKKEPAYGSSKSKREVNMGESYMRQLLGLPIAEETVFIPCV